MAANPAGLRTITEILEHPGPGEPIQGSRKVTAKLNSPGWINAGAREKVYTREAVVDPATGIYSLVLEVNADIYPTNTSWVIKEPGNRLWTIQVPAGDPAVSLTLLECLVADPTNPNPIVAGVSVADFDAYEATVAAEFAGLSTTYVRLPVSPPTRLGQTLIVTQLGSIPTLSWSTNPEPLYPAATLYPSTTLYPQAA